MYTLPVYLLVGIINIVAKRNNYNIKMEEIPDMDIRVKRSAMEDIQMVGEKEMPKEMSLIDILRNHHREKKEIKANTKYNENQYNQNQLNLPYSDKNSKYNQNLANFYNNNYNTDPYNFNHYYDTATYNPYYNVGKNGEARNFNNNVNNNMNYNDKAKNSNTNVNNNGVNDYTSSNGNGRDSRSTIGDSVTNNLNTTETSTIRINEGRIFSIGCPKGKKRISWYCM